MKCDHGSSVSRGISRLIAAKKIRPDQMDEVLAASLVSADLAADQADAGAARIRQELAAMEQLRQRERQALLLSAMEELSTEEIVAALGKSKSTLRSLLFRARTHLRERLKE